MCAARTSGATSGTRCARPGKIRCRERSASRPVRSFTRCSIRPLPRQVSETGGEALDQGVIERGRGAVVSQLEGLELIVAEKRLRVEDLLAVLAGYHKPVCPLDLVRHFAGRAGQAARDLGQPLSKGLVQGIVAPIRRKLSAAFVRQEPLAIAVFSFALRDQQVLRVTDGILEPHIDVRRPGVSVARWLGGSRREADRDTARQDVKDGSRLVHAISIRRAEGADGPPFSGPVLGRNARRFLC